MPRGRLFHLAIGQEYVTWQKRQLLQPGRWLIDKLPADTRALGRGDHADHDYPEENEKYVKHRFTCAKNLSLGPIYNSSASLARSQTALFC
jgi:hypothetical protein